MKYLNLEKLPILANKCSLLLIGNCILRLSVTTPNIYLLLYHKLTNKLLITHS